MDVQRRRVSWLWGERWGSSLTTAGFERSAVLFFFLPFLVNYQKDTMQRRLDVKLNFSFPWQVCVVLLPIPAWNWQGPLKSALQLTHHLQHIFLKDLWKFYSHDYWKMYWKYRHPGLGRQVPLSAHRERVPVCLGKRANCKKWGVCAEPVPPRRLLCQAVLCYPASETADCETRIVFTFFSATWILSKMLQFYYSSTQPEFERQGFRCICKAIHKQTVWTDSQPRPNNVIIMSSPCKFKSRMKLTHLSAYVQSYLGLGGGEEKKQSEFRTFATMEMNN